MTKNRKKFWLNLSFLFMNGKKNEIWDYNSSKNSLCEYFLDNLNNNNNNITLKKKKKSR